MSTLRAPRGLGPAGRALWRAVVADNELDGIGRVMLTEACRMKDRLDALAETIAGDGRTFRQLDLGEDGPTAVLVVTDPVSLANTTARQQAQILGGLRLASPDGRRPQRRGSRRGIYSGAHRWGSPS